MLDPIIKERVNILEPQYRDFVLGDEPVTIAGEFARSYNLDELKSAVLENGIILFLLFFFNKPDLENLFIEEYGLDAGEASSLVEAIIMSLPESIRTAQEETRKQIFNKQEPATPNISVENITNPNEVGNITPKILEEFMRKGVSEPEIDVIKSNLEHYLSNPATSEDKKQLWAEWSKNNTFGLQLGLNTEGSKS